MSNKSTLSADDVSRLLKDPSPENRAVTAQKVSAHFDSVKLTPSERALAEDIFRAMVHDTEVMVRKALAESLRNNPEVPHEVALTLARDVASVALPMIESSQVLTDADLVEIIRSKGEEHQTAVAKRAEVSEQISEALVETKSEKVVSTLVGNDGAKITEKTFEKVLSEFGESEKVKTPMARRRQLPIKVAEKLVSMVSDNLREHLVTHHDLSPHTAMDLFLAARERATVGLLDGSSNTMNVRTLVEQLHRNGRLTPSIIIRALCMGDLTFFEAALAKKANIPVANAYQLVHDRGAMGLERLFRAADMPEDLVKFARIGVSVAEEMNLTSGDDRNLFQKVMIERVITQLDDDMDAEKFGDNLDYLVGKLSSVQSAA